MSTSNHLAAAIEGSLNSDPAGVDAVRTLVKEVDAALKASVTVANVPGIPALDSVNYLQLTINGTVYNVPLCTFAPA